MKISVVSGGFDPLHSGHINLLESAASYGDKLVVLLKILFPTIIKSPFFK